MSDRIDDIEKRVAALEHWRDNVVVCPECGPTTRMDEDGCCVSCGADLWHDENGERTVQAPEVYDAAGFGPEPPVGEPGEDRTEDPTWYYTWTADGVHYGWRATGSMDSDIQTEEHAREGAWAHHDRITAPPRAECERLRAESEEHALIIRDLRTEHERLRTMLRDAYATAAEPADECERLRERVRELEAERAEAAAEHLRVTCRAEKAERERDEAREDRDRLAVAHHKQRDIIASNVVLTDRLRRDAANARRTTIEELIADAPTKMHPGEALWVCRWLRSQLDREPTEQPTPDAPFEWRCACGESDCDGCEYEEQRVAIEAAREEGRREERERCAKVAEEEASFWSAALCKDGDAGWIDRCNARVSAALRIEDRIRALPTQPGDTTEEDDEDDELHQAWEMLVEAEELFEEWAVDTEAPTETETPTPEQTEGDR